MKEKTIDYILRATWQGVSRMYNEEASKYGATMSVGFALLSIDKENGTPVSEISNRMGMEPTSLTRTLKSMEDKGLIFRKPNPNDGRGVLVFLTEFGLKMRSHSKEIVIKFNDTVKNSINAEKLKIFNEVTDIINDLVQENNIFNQTENVA